MNRTGIRVTGACTAALAAIAVGLAAPAQAAEPKHCASGAQWQGATPAEAGMDAAKLTAAVDYGSQNLGLAIRVYRNGCLVAGDRGMTVNQYTPFQSWSMSKSITSMVFGRAWTLGLINPGDTVGALFPEADDAHAAITMRDLATQTSGLHLGPEDFNLLAPDRVRQALDTPVDHEPGTTYGYSQSAVVLLAEAVARATGEDFQAFAQRELFGPIGIRPGAWSWFRDLAGHTQGYWGLNMRPDDYARFGELLRRDGVWAGKRLLSSTYAQAAVTPTATNGCYGWLIWLNAKPCVGGETRWPGLPAGMYGFNGLDHQVVTVFPEQGVQVVRLGALPTSADRTWELGLYRLVLDSVVA